jgi:hypothetical protein
MDRTVLDLNNFHARKGDMTRRMFIFGLGFCTGHLRRYLHDSGWSIVATRRNADADAFAFDNRAAIEQALASATHIISSVPPVGGGRSSLGKLWRSDRARAGPLDWLSFIYRRLW